MASPLISDVHPLSIQIRVHHLNDGENLESVMFRVKKGWILQFKLGPTLFGRTVKLFLNYPNAPDRPFKRKEYREVMWKNESFNKGDDTSLYCEVIFELAGTFHYFFIDEENHGDTANGAGYILVEPSLTYGPDNEELPLDCILCQTYLAKCLGPFPEWERRLMVTKESGYNMVHITPIQELGGSHSSYSLRNQLKLNPSFNTATETFNMNDVTALMEKMKVEWKVMSLTDVVLNHTANESTWLREHPDAGYNLINSPHLRPAYLLDRALWYLSIQISEGKWTTFGVPIEITEHFHVESIRSLIYAHTLNEVKVHEMFMVDVPTLVDEFKQKIQESVPSAEVSGEDLAEDRKLEIIQDHDYGRLKSTVDMNLAIQMHGTTSTSIYDIKLACSKFKHQLEDLNRQKYSDIENHVNAAVDNVLKAVYYERLDSNGPKLGAVSKKHPLVPRYFHNYDSDTDLATDETIMYTKDASCIFAHNGWVMGDNPLRNFADPDSYVYLRRELIAWGDSCKLRYGEKPEDSPYLWGHMTQYVQQMARAFHGLRLDNCHSTPIHVAEYLIDKARDVRPDLYVIAELFTSSEAVDNVFVNRLGICSLVREAMSAHDAHEQGRLVYRYGGDPVGSFVHPVVRPLTMSIAHAIFMDITHDNQCPVQTRSVYDLFPTAAIVTMACCATGSTRGYDELVPHQINVVTEERHYTSWCTDRTKDEGLVSMESGIIAGKRALNNLHRELGSGGYSQVFVDQRDADIVAITRHCPATHQSVILVAHTAFSQPSNPERTGYVKPLIIPGVIEEIILEARLESMSYVKHEKNERFINGLGGYKLVIKEHLHLCASTMVEVANVADDDSQELDFVRFPPGSVVAFKVSLDSVAKTAILKVRTCVSQFGYRMRSYSGNILQREGHDFESIISRLSLTDLNYVLFRSDAEERDHTRGEHGVYSIPNYSSFVYCGLQGIMSELMSIHLTNDLGHPLCENLRQGNWLPSYVSNRLLRQPSTQDLGQWFQHVFQNLNQIPHYLVPCYFDSVITGAYSSILTSLWRKMSDFISEGSTFVKALALGSVILLGIVDSSALPMLSPDLEPPFPHLTLNANNEQFQTCVTLSAGFPHFAVGCFRNWGRDTFISLRGLLLITGRAVDARFIILAYAACLRHGLIPNLLDGGRNPRYNCRDAVWWWLQSIQDYTKMVPDGHKILQDKVSRLFPDDDSPNQEPGAHDQRLRDVMQEALQRHFTGVKFRERNAGYQIDEQMKDTGFNNEIGVDSETGFVFGGNGDNCGTWMDKMGSSDKAGNKGQPATPRDGSAVEIVGLCASTLRWLSGMHQEGHYPCNFVKGEDDEQSIVTFAEWHARIQENFEKCFWIPVEKHVTDGKYINKRGFYKDSYNASSPWADFQLRPNYFITMVVAPELFNPENAWTAIKVGETHLLGPLGMKTLDSSDWAYDGYYVNSDDSDNPKRAKGFNYHQGPEWLWPIGYFLRAKLHFAYQVGGEKELSKAVSFTKHTISHHFKEIQVSKWKGLYELTNKDGAFCQDSCYVQAWSHAVLIEVLYDLARVASS